MVNLERALRQQRLREKLQSVVLAGVTIPEGEVAQKFADDNISYQTEFLTLDPHVMVPDSTIPASDDEIRSFYDKHIKDYKIEATRKVKYVTFTLTTSKNDTEYVRQEMEDILRRVREGADFEELAAANSTVPATDVFFKHGELQPETETAVYAAKAGEIVGPVLGSRTVSPVKVLEFKSGKDDYIRAQHVLIRVEGTDSAAAREKARVSSKARAERTSARWRRRIRASRARTSARATSDGSAGVEW